MNTLEKALEYFAILTLVLVGALGIIIGVADFVGWETQLLTITKEPITLVLVTVGLLSLSLGIERVVRFKQQDQRLTSIENTLNRASGGQYLRGTDEIYGSTIRLINSVQNQIRALVFSSGPKAPNRWAETVALRLRYTKRIGSPAKYEVVLGADLEKLPPDFEEINDRRQRIYAKYGTEELVSVYLLNIKPPLGFDILILDRKHVVIGFTTASGIEQLQSAIMFENQPEIASRLADWFDQVVLRQAISYMDFIEKQGKN